MHLLSEAQKIVEPLTSFWQDSDEPWGTKHSESLFIYANSRFMSLLTIPALFWSIRYLATTREDACLWLKDITI